MIIPLYKPIGISTHAFIKDYSSKNNVIATHTGSLDPMADGVVVVLTDEDRFKKDSFASDKKEYVFSLVSGFCTDTEDLLGLIEEVKIDSDKTASEPQILTALPRFVGEQEQVIPRFAAKRIDGESYFSKASRGETFEQETQRVEVYSLEMLQTVEISAKYFKSEIEEKIGKVVGSFRQQEVLDRWVEVFSIIHVDEVLHRFLFKTVVSRRFYIRGLARDLSSATNMPLVVSSITRTRNGPYSLENV